MHDAGQQEHELNRIHIGIIVSMAIGIAAGALGLLAQPGALEAQSHTATRSFQQDWAAPGSDLRVTITASNYGPIGQVVETLPAGFTYVRTSLDDFQVEVNGRTVSFNLLGNRAFTYVLTAPSAEGEYTFSGVVKNADREERTISGDTMLRVGPPPPPPVTPELEPSVTPEPEPSVTPEPEPPVTPEPEPTATPEPEPTATPEPEPTATPEPEPTATPTPEPTVTPTPEPTATPEPEPTAAPATAAPPTPPAQESSGGVPAWLIVLVVAGIVLVVGGVAAYVRRRRR